MPQALRTNFFHFSMHFYRQAVPLKVGALKSSVGMDRGPQDTPLSGGFTEIPPLLMLKLVNKRWPQRSRVIGSLGQIGSAYGLNYVSQEVLHLPHKGIALI